MRNPSNATDKKQLLQFEDYPDGVYEDEYGSYDDEEESGA